MHLLSSLILILVLATPGLSSSDTESQHSIQKRQTTVRSFLPSFNSISRTIGGISLETVLLLALAFIIADVLFTVTAVAVTGRSNESLSFGRWLRESFFNSIDLVDTGLNWMEIEGESCRQRAICEAEYAASQNTIARLAINTINSNLRGLDKYSEAVDAGLNGADCALLYSECPPSTYQGIFSIF